MRIVNYNFSDVCYSIKNATMFENYSGNLVSQTYYQMMYKEAEKTFFETQDRFYSPESGKEISDEIRRIVEVESPITENLLDKRISQEWKFNLTGVKISKTVNACVPSDLKTIRK